MIGPRRIVCLTEEPTETLYLLGEQERIVGISGFTVRPPEARRDKPKVSAFTSAKVDRILALKPDLAIGFSDIQADIAQALIKAGVEVWISNHRSVDGIVDYIRRLGAMAGVAAKADRLAGEMERGLDATREASSRLPRRPKVYFEEWDEPFISGIRWVSELVGIAGGDDVLPHRAVESLAKHRIIGDAREIIDTAPDIIIGSWCGKRFRPEQVKARAGWEAVPAIVSNDLYEVKSPLILQPGPAALTDGLAELRRIIHTWAARVA